MKLLILLVCFIHSVLGNSFPSGAFVISAEFISELSKIPAGVKYRVYGVYATGYGNEYPSKVYIMGSDGVKTILQLATPKTDTQYVLSETNVMTSPFTYSNDNTPPPEGVPAFFPFTLYFVPTTIPAFPVISGQYATYVDSSLAGITSPGCTIISAQGTFQLWGIDAGSGPVSVTNVGYDAPQMPNVVLAVTSARVGSSVQMSGPIATFWNPASTNAVFRFQVMRSNAYSGTLNPSASTSFLSNGWLNDNESYQTDYRTNANARSRSYDYGRETQITFVPTIGSNFNTKVGDSLNLTCYKADGKKTEYSLGDLNGKSTTDYCTSVAMFGYTTQYDEMRFRVIVDSAANSISIVILLLLSLIPNF